MGAENIISVTITRETRPLGETGFGTVLILGPNATFNERIKYYTDSELATLASELTGTTSSLEYIMASTIFSQTPHINRVAVGRKLVNKLVFAGDLITGNKVNLNVNGSAITEVTFTTDHATTMGLVASAIAAKTSYVLSATVTAAREITIVPVVGVTLALTGIAITAGATQTTASQTGNPNYSDALNDIILVSNDWYGVVVASRAKSDQKNVATWVESQSKVAVFSSDDTDIINSAEEATSIAYHLESNSLFRSAAIYHSYADTQAIDAGLLGMILAWDPGSYTGAFKTISGCTNDSLTPSQISVTHAKKCSTYEEIKDQNMVLFAWVGTGEYLDIPIFADWIVERITEGVIYVKYKNKKVPFTDGGITAIESAVKKVLEIGIQNNGITPQQFDTDGNQIGGYFTLFPKSSAVSSNDKANRRLTGAKFTAWLSGAIHTTAIEGTLTL